MNAPLPLPTTSAPPTNIGACATLACLWEATAPKPGNVYRGADFEDLTYVDFLTSAAVIGPAMQQAAEVGVGTSVLEAVRRTRATVATNTNLGLLLLIAPLATVPPETLLPSGIGVVLRALTSKDAAQVFAAIRLAQPGGLGSVAEADVEVTTAPEISLLDAMELAADRDLVARQYGNDFAQVFAVASHIEEKVESGWPLSEAIVRGFLQLLADYPDSLIARKCGPPVAQQVSTQAAAVLCEGEPGEGAYETARQDFDFALRAEGHRRNPGTSADIIGAALFVLLRDNRLRWPVRFYD